MIRILSESTPASRGGRKVAYHTITGGFILGEVVRRITGKDIRQMLAELVLEPLHFSWMNFGAPDRYDQVATNYFTGRRPPLLIRAISRNALGVPFESVPEISNDPRWHRGVVPREPVRSYAALQRHHCRHLCACAPTGGALRLTAAW